MKQCLFLISILTLPLCLQAKNDFQPKNQLCFLENKGQVTDQYHHHRTDVQYKLEAGDMSVFIGNGQLHYQFYHSQQSNTNAFKQPIPGHRPIVDKPLPIDMYRMDVTLVGANPNAEVKASEPITFYEHYHTSLLKDVTVHSYKKITYTNIYPNIDWVLYIKDNHLEYDFVVRPGGKVGDIQLRYGGATGLVQNSDGSITAVTPMGTISEASPASHQQDGQKVASRFVMKRHTLHFTTAPYTGILVIDPVLAWGTYYSNGTINFVDQLCTLTIDTDGVYIATKTNLTSNIATTGAWQTVYGGGESDIFIACFDTVGNRLWATYFGGNGYDYGYKIIHNTNNNLYLTGQTNSTDLSTPGTWQPSYGDSTDAFLAKFDAGGNLQWCTYYGGTNTDVGEYITCDNNGDIYMTGFTNSSTGIATAGAWQTAYSDSSDVFLTKFNSSGNLLWGTYYGGTHHDAGVAVACDNMGQVDLLSWTSNDNMATAGAAQPTPGGNQDNLLTQFSNSGALLWSTYYGGSQDDFGLNMICDNASNIYIIGYTFSPNNIATPGSYQSSFNNTQSGFLTKYNSTGQWLWGTYYSCSFSSVMGVEPLGIGVDNDNHIWIGGNAPAGLPITAGAWQYNFLGNSNTGATDPFLAEFTTNGHYLRGTYYGSAASIYDMLVYGNSIYVSGIANATSVQIATPGAFQYSLTNGPGAFLARFVSDSFYIPMPVADTMLCGGDTLHLPYYCNFTFKAPNTFTALLSDTSGSFAGAMSIGTRVDTLSDTITCVLPRNTMTGYHKILVTGNNLADTTTDTLTVFVTSTAPPIASVDSPLCPGDTLHLFADTIAQAIYRWTGPDNFSSSLQNPVIDSVAMVNTGSYFVTDSLNGCRSLPDTVSVVLNSATTITMYITVYPLTYVQGQNVTFTAHIAPSVPGLAYQWYRNGVPIAGATDSTYSSSSVNKGDHIYLVVQSFDGNCISPHTITSNTIAVAVPNVTSSNDALSIYPNPNNGAFMLKGTVGATVHSLPVSVINALGQVVYSGSAAIHNGRVNQQLNLALAPGNYQVIVGDAVLRLEVVR